MSKTTPKFKLGALLIRGLPIFVTLFIASSGLALPNCLYFMPFTSTTPRLAQIKNPNELAIRNSPLFSYALEKARELHLVSDFKTLADLVPNHLSDLKLEEIKKSAKDVKANTDESQETRFLLSSLFEAKDELLPAPNGLADPKWTIDQEHKPTFDYIERTWNRLVKVTPTSTDSSLISVPFPIVIPGSRFQESYYWDSYFAVRSFLDTGRIELAKMQVENFLFMIEHYELVPNGLRDYYLTRSQPPLLSSMVREILGKMIAEKSDSQETYRWLKGRALPLIQRDYFEFWMNSQTRLDAATGLNHHYDSIDLPREERHSADMDQNLAKTFRDVRAEAESGKDFTDAFGGEATAVAPVLLNTVLYKAERDLAWMHALLGERTEAEKFNKLAEKRKLSMNRLMWDDASGVYRDFHLGTQKQMPIVTADTFIPLYFGLSSSYQAKRTRNFLSKLEYAGGIGASVSISGKQWDLPFGWAPHQFFAVFGLKNYGYLNDANRIAAEWVNAIDKIFKKTGGIPEKIDVISASSAIEDGTKYQTQEGFLWTNAVYTSFVTEIFKTPLLQIGASRVLP